MPFNFLFKKRKELENNEEISFFPAVPSNNIMETNEEKSKDKKTTKAYKNPFESKELPTSSITIFINDSITTCAEACSCCWDKKMPEDYTSKIDYVGRRCITGHTSILEHSNFVVGVYVDKSDVSDLVDFLSYNRYLHTIIKHSYSHTGSRYLIIGGSWRGYIDLFLNQPDMNNKIFICIKQRIYSDVPKEIMHEVITKGYMNEDSFMSHQMAPSSYIQISNNNHGLYYTSLDSRLNYDITSMISIKNMDDLVTIKYLINKYIEEDNRPLNDYLTECELADFATITICFKNMSRTATHQLVRHRNGITQESQRYVNYEDHKVINPLLYSSDRYTNDSITSHKYDIGDYKSSIEEIFSKIKKYYSVLINDKVAPLHKEDARAVLPQNIACGRLYMTFTFRSFAKFLELRTHKAAQGEIRAFACACEDSYNDIWNHIPDMNYKLFLQTRFDMIESKNQTEEVIKED